jgi:hypothetical protein
VSPYFLKWLTGIAAVVGVTVGGAIWRRRGRRVLRHYHGGRITHHRRSRFVEAAFSLVPALVLTGAMAMFAGAWGDTAFAAGLSAGLAVSAVCIWRLVVVSITVDADEVRVTNFFRNYRVRWEDIASVTRGNSRTWSFLSWFGSDYGAPQTVRLELRDGDGRYVTATAALRATNFSNPDVRILRALEEQAKAHDVPCDELDSAALGEMGLS